jgi:DNA-binding response OmpR family regulator
MNEPSGISKRPTNLLLLERDPELRRSVRLALERDGVEVWTAPDAVHAREILAQRSPDLIVLDHENLAEHLGPLIAQYRGGDDGKEGIVLVTTARRIDDGWRLRHRPDFVIYKPFDVRFLCRRVKALVKPAGAGTNQGDREKMNSQRPFSEFSVFSVEDLRDLISAGEAPSVSIYMPTSSAGPETQQNPIRLKNLITEAENRLIDLGVRTREVQGLLGGLHQQVTTGGVFRESRDPGLAIFVCPGFARFHRLPLHFDELVVTGDRFHVKPLLPLLTGDGHYFVLAISQNEIRLLRGTRDTVTEVELEDVPRGLAETLKFDVAERQLQHRMAGAPHTGRQPAVFHGHGGLKDVSRSNLTRYFHQVDDGLQKILRGERAPLVLAGVDYVRSAYAEISDYPGLAEDGINGSPDEVDPTELHAAAWEIVRPHFARIREEASARYKELVQTGKASDGIEAIVPAAFHGGVDTLFVAVGRQVWGVFDPERNTVAVHPEKQPGDDDLVDFAAVHTLLNGGEVFAGEAVPSGTPACAVFRYETG